MSATMPRISALLGCVSCSFLLPCKHFALKMFAVGKFGSVQFIRLAFGLGFRLGYRVGLRQVCEFCDFGRFCSRDRSVERRDFHPFGVPWISACDPSVSGEPFWRSGTLRALRLPGVPAVHRTCGINRLSITDHRTGGDISEPRLRDHMIPKKYIWLSHCQ